MKQRTHLPVSAAALLLALRERLSPGVSQAGTPNTRRTVGLCPTCRAPPGPRVTHVTAAWAPCPDRHVKSTAPEQPAGRRALPPCLRGPPIHSPEIQARSPDWALRLAGSVLATTISISSFASISSISRTPTLLFHARCAPRPSCSQRRSSPPPPPPSPTARP